MKRITLTLQQIALSVLAIFFLCSCATHATPESPNERRTYYLSPDGNNWGSGLAPEKPFKTFSHAFSKMNAGDELVLLDGMYSEATGTGAITYTDFNHDIGGRNSAQIPSGVNPERPTLVRALNPGKVTVTGRLFIGRSFRKDSFIAVRGITFEGGAKLYNTSYITIMDCGFHGAFILGTNDHNQGNDHNLIEDVWIWATGERVIAINYRSRYNVWRRVLVRGDGCGTSSCRGNGNPNVGISIYDSSNISFQNVMVVDRILAETDKAASDFATAQHTPGAHFFGQNEWLGSLSLRSPYHGFNIEPDSGATFDPTMRAVNIIAWDAAQLGVNVSRAGTNITLENITVRALGGDGVRVAPEMTSGSLRNVLSVDAGHSGINSKYPPRYTNVYNASAASYRQTLCDKGCYAINPWVGPATPSLIYLTRIEEGSFLKGRGEDGADIGANMLYRYGVEGSRHGETGYNTLTSEPLWPWPNEDRIKREMCASTSRGFCQSRSLTRYIWEYLGHPIPKDIYGGAAAKQ